MANAVLQATPSPILAGAELSASAAVAPPAPRWQGPPVVVVGGGPCGVRVAEALGRRGVDAVVLNAEKWDPYNRVKLTPLLAGDVQLGDVSLSSGSEGPGAVSVVNGARVEAVDLLKKTATTADGGVWPFHKLVIATGSAPFMPKIPGRDRPGVYVFRDASDVEALIARSFTARNVVVVGGGLLGLEAARGMHRRGAQVTIVEHENRLMPRQLDEAAAAHLADKVRALGVTVETGLRVAEIACDPALEHPSDPVSAVVLSDGRRLETDTVIVCAGVRARLDLARELGLKIGRGVSVNDAMRTSAIDVYAVGECAEHRDIVYGLVGPGLEQADVAAAAIAGHADADYQGSTPATKLKVIGAEVFSIGDVEALEERPNVRSIVWEKPEDGLYRRIFVERGRLVGAIAVGEWSDASRAQAAALAKDRLYLWTTRRFQNVGLLWPEIAGAATPPQAIVCNCTGVTCGRISDAITLGAASLEEVRGATGANTVCGSCGPKIEELLNGGAPAAARPVKLHKSLLWLSGIGAALAMITLVAPRVPLPDSYRGAPIMEALWFDGIVKQWSGYILLALSVLAGALGLRKRIGLLRRLGGYDWWRIVHVGIGAACVITLFAHTGFRFGSGLNAWLMAAFCATLVFGAAAGLVTGGEHKLREQGLATADRSPKSPSLWLHVIALWPLPALVALHVLTVYAY